MDLAKQTAVVYSQSGADKDHTHAGQKRVEQPVYQFTAYAPTRPQVKAISAQLKAALCDYSGTMGGLEVQYIRLDTELYDTERPGDGITVSVCVLEFQIYYVRS